MKKLILLFSVLIFLAGCKTKFEELCEGPDCPLTDGSNCPGSTINIDNQCVCPPGSEMLSNSFCWEPSGWDTIADFYFFDIDCECVDGDLLISVNHDNPIGGGYSLSENFAPSGDVRIGGGLQFLPGSTRSYFNALLHPAKCEGNDLYLHGSMLGDTLLYELFFINSSSLDTCGPFRAYPL